MQLFRHLSWFFRRYWYTYSLALVMLFIVALVNMAVPQLIGRAIDRLLATGEQASVEPFLLGLVAAGVVVYLLRYGWLRHG